MLRSFFCYFGGKWALARHLGPPRYSHVVEPFAGGAGYSLYWEPPQVTLIEKSPLIAQLWRYLIQVSEREILSIPVDKDHVDDLVGVCEEGRWLVGFWFNRGVSSPRKQRSAWCKQYQHKWPRTTWTETSRGQVASQLCQIRHWRIIEGSYETAPDIEAHWYVDPPYVGVKGYECSQVDYPMLSVWCQTRQGFIQVSEAKGADWLPFLTFMEVKGTAGRYRKGVTKEVLWEVGW